MFEGTSSILPPPARNRGGVSDAPQAQAWGASLVPERTATEPWICRPGYSRIGCRFMYVRLRQTYSAGPNRKRSSQKAENQSWKIHTAKTTRICIERSTVPKSPNPCP